MYFAFPETYFLNLNFSYAYYIIAYISKNGKINFSGTLPTHIPTPSSAVI